MNSLLASNINGGIINEQIANASRTPVLLSSIEFNLTEIMKHPSQPGKIIKLSGNEDALFNGQNKVKNFDQNKNPIENHVTMNGNKDKSVEDTLPVPKIQLYTGKIHAEWNQLYKIGAGLTNLGNTCFMNTVIQCLTYCPPLANYLLHDTDHFAQCTITGFCMMCILQKHMKRAIGKTGEIIKPLDMYQRLKLIAKHFQHGRQEDAHEFLRYVIDHLWKSCLPQTNGVNKLDSASKETTVINKIFGGYHRSQVICLRCKKQSNTFDHFMDFILDIKQNVMSLEKALDKYIQPEMLQQENCYKCPKCKMKVDAQKKFSVYRAPTVATFQLKRFDYNRSFGGKITKQITYPEMLNLRPYMSDTQGDAVWYRLNSVLVHSGPSCNSGHYYCYVKNSNGCWYVMDDQRVHPVSVAQVLSQIAYVLFYIKMDNTERGPLKKCVVNKNSLMKGSISNSHSSNLGDMNNGKGLPLSEKISPFSSSKSYNSPNSIKKLNFSPSNREKISFGFRTNSSSVVHTSSKNRTMPSETVTANHGGLVPYTEDSSESSDAGEGVQSKNKLNSVSCSDVKHHSKHSVLENYMSMPHLESKNTLSKSVLNMPSRSFVNSCPKVNATGSWTVTDAPQTPSSSTSASTGVNSTTDWHVIEASEVKANGSPDVNENKNFNSKELPNLPKTSNHETSASKHSANDNEVLISDPVSSVAKSNGYETSPSAQKCNFRKEIHKSKYFHEDKEVSSPLKRKNSDTFSKVSKDSSPSEHSESRCNPVPKKAKLSENSTFLSSESDVRNNDSNVKSSINGSSSSSAQMRQYATSNCDNNSRTCLMNGVSNPKENARNSPNKNSINLNNAREVGQDNHEKGCAPSKGKQDNSHTESSKSFQHVKEKLPICNQGKSTSLYGTEVPTWRQETHFRPSVMPGHEVRRSFDNYDNEFDRGKVRKSKPNDRYQYFNKKNPFQKYSDRYHGKYSGKFYNSHHNHRKYDSRHNWKSNRSDGYQRYRNQHRHY